MKSNALQKLNKTKHNILFLMLYYTLYYINILGYMPDVSDNLSLGGANCRLILTFRKRISPILIRMVLLEFFLLLSQLPM